MTDQEAQSGSIVRAAPGLARIAVTASLRTAEWALDASLRTASRVARAAASGEPPSELLGDLGGELRDYARGLLGLVEDGATPEDEPDSRGEALRRRGWSSCGARRTSITRTSFTRRTSASSSRWRPTRPGSCGCSGWTGRSRRSTCGRA